MFTCRKEKLLAEYVSTIHDYLDFMLSLANLDSVQSRLLDISAALISFLLNGLHCIRFIVNADNYLLLCIISKRNKSGILDSRLN